MRAKRIILASLLLVLILVGCGSSGGEPRHVVSIKTDNGVISYGMTQEEAEKILGRGENYQSGSYKVFLYDNAISIYYREDSLCYISIDSGKSSIYNGINVGESKEKVLEKHKYEYTDKYNTSAFFDENQSEIENNPATRNEWKYIVSYYFEDDKLAKATMCDKQYAQQLR